MRPITSPQHLLVRRADRGDLRRHLGIGRDHVGEDRDEPEAIALHLAVAHVEIEPRDELAVAAGGDQQRLADLDRRPAARRGCGR